MNTLQVSKKLLAAVAKQSHADPALIRAYEAGAMPTKPANQAVRFKQLGMPPGFGPHGEFARQNTVRDRTASRGRKRMMGGAGCLPHTIRGLYTEGERAALTVICLEVKRRGWCNWPIDKIAAKAGVSVRTVQYALATARAYGHIVVEYRPISGRRNLPNLIRIISTEWLSWLKRGPSLNSMEIGCKALQRTMNIKNEGVQTEGFAPLGSVPIGWENK